MASHLVTIIKALDPKIEVIKMHRDCWIMGINEESVFYETL